mmetsp:Transcript_58896/g.119943  ORF Transcript_58896/g.119943 Transcript_58896/m.119943 type:complete len:294 (-) Transcript_58896:528-1409(-)
MHVSHICFEFLSSLPTADRMGEAMEDLPREVRYGPGQIPRRDAHPAVLRIHRIEDRPPPPAGQTHDGSLCHVEASRSQAKGKDGLRQERTDRNYGLHDANGSVGEPPPLFRRLQPPPGPPLLRVLQVLHLPAPATDRGSIDSRRCRRARGNHRIGGGGRRRRNQGARKGPGHPLVPPRVQPRPGMDRNGGGIRDRKRDLAGMGDPRGVFFWRRGRGGHPRRRLQRHHQEARGPPNSGCCGRGERRRRKRFVTIIKPSNDTKAQGGWHHTANPSLRGRIAHPEKTSKRSGSFLT